VPRDNLADTKDMLDWLGDHPHTNDEEFHRRLRLGGYFIDILDVPLTCITREASDAFGALLLFDSEDFFTDEEVKFLEPAVKMSGMSIVITTEWHDDGVMRILRFEDDNTCWWWEPVISGGNVPSSMNSYNHTALHWASWSYLAQFDTNLPGFLLLAATALSNFLLEARSFMGQA
jgi:hypothetical protein